MNMSKVFKNFSINVFVMGGPRERNCSVFGKLPTADTSTNTISTIRGIL
jgi:hypothetical protein